MSDLSVQIKNFQIIENARLKFSNGLNIIVGPSNNGKSAIIRAIEALVYNKPGNSFIRNGTDYTAVAVLTEDGRKVIFKKSANAGEYIIDGQSFNKIGRGQLDEVADALNMREINVNDDKVRINFLKQMEYPFLLDKNPTQLFNFLAMSNDTSKLAEVFTKMRSDLKSANTEVTELIGRIDGLNEIITRDTKLLENYKDIDTIVNHILGLDSKVNNLNNTQQEVISIENKYTKLQELKSVIIRLRGIVAIAKTSLDGLDTRIKAFDDFKSKVSLLLNQRAELLLKKERFSSLKNDLKSLTETLSSLDLTLINKKKVDISELKTSISSLESRRSVLSSKESAISLLKTSLNEVQQELSQFKVCPLCGQSLGGDHDGLLH